MRSRSQCSVCSSTSLEGITERPNVPVHQNKLYDSRSAARAATRGDLDVVACLTCGFVFNASFDLSLMSYGAGYENDQTHSPAFSAYVDKLADGLLNESGVRDSRIVEVGCGKGAFLKALVTSPDSGNVGWGFDPAYAGPVTELGGRLNFVRSFYSGEYADISPDVVICRHVIEHVPDPATLLAQIRQASSGARVFIETPDVEWILRNTVIWDFFYEHCSYFSSHSIATVFRAAGFHDVNSTSIFGNQYMWTEASASDQEIEGTGNEPGAIAQLVESYVRLEGEMRMRWSETLAMLRKKGPIALWGAGAKGVTSASLFDPQTELLSCVVDLNPEKQGRFIAGSGHAIVPPADLAKLGVKSVVLMNPNYRAEVEELLEQARIDVNVVVGANEFLVA